MDKRIAAALADELLTTVIHKMQLPGSKTQVEVQGVAVDILVDTLREKADLDFPDSIKGLVEDVVDQMPAAYGSVPQVFSRLREVVEETLSKDPFLKCVVIAHGTYGSKDQLDEISILQRPDVPQAVKDEILDGGIFIAPSSSMLDAATTIIKALSVDVVRDITYISVNALAALEGDELAAAVAEMVATGKPDRLATAPCDIVGAMDLMARIDNVLYRLYRHHRHRYYDKKEV